MYSTVFIGFVLWALDLNSPLVFKISTLIVVIQLGTWDWLSCVTYGTQR